ncbi:unnamed protein product [Kuraishia capsulata CBS 1993]|uniref:t-SNARE coiled-coil homology domain-containing protein n=1 Tax=Kuraishia capsulata CBS 1993 TaxID=1382522 RepID=W6MXT6_9ASCO|nr:uncharacterized protein KUCA_T00005438001 [Kuraishia capsulata CBS 1993]CDK29450.1 unnamed protein product [Kuraishia capsulata CBS 1993]
MKFKRLFKPPAESTEEETKEYLQNRGFVDLAFDRKKKNKFAAFDQYAKDKHLEAGELAPRVYDPENDLNNYPGNAATAESEVNESSIRDPYAQVSNDPYSQPIANDPYAAYNTSADVYRPKAQKQRSDPQIDQRQRSDPRLDQRQKSDTRLDQKSSLSGQPVGNLYTSTQGKHQESQPRNPYGNQYGYGDEYDDHAPATTAPQAQSSQPELYSKQGEKPSNQNSYDISHDPYSDNYSQPPSYRDDPYGGQAQSLYAPSTRIQTAPQDLDQNEVALEEEDLNDYPGFHTQQQQNYHSQTDYAINQDYLSPEELERQRQQEEEDEAVEGIKGQIRTIKQDTLYSSNNMLAHLNKAREDARNTLGETGNQGYKLNEIEQDLHLAEKQQKVAEQGVKDLAHYNRGLFSVRVGNPFNRKTKLRAEEARFKNERILHKQEAQERTKEWYRAQQNLVDSMENGVSRTKHGVNSPIYQKYERERVLNEAKKYQFEADEEDDELEVGIAKNTDEALKIASDLKNMSLTMGQEIDRQNKIIANIGDRADRIDTNLSYDVQRLKRIG